MTERKSEIKMDSTSRFRSEATVSLPSRPELLATSEEELISESMRAEVEASMGRVKSVLGAWSLVLRDAERLAT